MRCHLTTAVLLLMIPCLAMAVEDAEGKHRDGSNKVADKQDELAADVQQLAIEQTVPQVIELLNEVEAIMDEATDQLAEADTGGKTIAAQTEIIEKIHAAAKEKRKQQGGGKSGEAMMEMMERMMGMNPDGEKKGQNKDGDAGDKGGQGANGLSDSANEGQEGETGGKTEARRVPKASGAAGPALPEEFRKAMDAYNRGVEKKVR
jgi:hypothetical protein